MHEQPADVPDHIDKVILSLREGRTRESRMPELSD
jgi:hypothetical protein